MCLKEIRKKWWEYWCIPSNTIFYGSDAKKILTHVVFKNPYRIKISPFNHLIFETDMGSFVCDRRKLIETGGVQWVEDFSPVDRAHRLGLIHNALGEEFEAPGGIVICLMKRKLLIPSPGGSFVNLKFNLTKPLNEFVFLNDLAFYEPDNMSLSLNPLEM